MLKRLLLVRGAEVAMFALLAAVPLEVRNPYALGLLTLLAIYGILLIGLDVTVGYLGQVNLAQAAFLGLGAYVAGIGVANHGWGLVASFGIGSGWREAPGLVLLILALAVRPTGVFGKAVIRKV